MTELLATTALFTYEMMERKKSQTAHKGLLRHTSAIFLIILRLQNSTAGKSTQKL